MSTNARSLSNRVCEDLVDCPLIIRLYNGIMYVFTMQTLCIFIITCFLKDTWTYYFSCISRFFGCICSLKANIVLSDMYVLQRLISAFQLLEWCPDSAALSNEIQKVLSHEHLESGRYQRYQSPSACRDAQKVHNFASQQELNMTAAPCRLHF